MNMLAMVPDKIAVDARGSQGTKAGTSGPADDDSATTFDGVLSDVATDQTPTKTDGPGAADPPAGDPTAAASADPSTAAHDGSPLEALMGMIGQAQAAATAATMTAGLRATGTSSKSTKSDESVDALLKRISKKEEEAKDSKDEGTTSTASAPGPLDALTALVAQIAPLAAQSAQGAPTTDAKSNHAPVPAAPNGPAPDATQVTAKGAIISDVAVETHLAVAPASARPSDSRGKSTTPVGTDPDALEKATASNVAAASTETAAPITEHREGHARDDSADRQAAPAPAKADPAKTDAVAAAPMITTDLGSLRRIASAVVQLAAAPNPTNAAVPDADPQAKAAAPARTLTLQMQPADLGTVDVRLHMSSDGLDLRLGISDERTLGMVSRERDTLTNLLQGQNYQVHSLVIQESSGGASTSSGGFAGNQNSSPQSNARNDRPFGPSGSNDQGTSQRQQQSDDRPQQNGRQTRETPPLRTPADSGTSLFV